MAAGRRISVTGLGYVGLPVAVAFARHGQVVGYDIDPGRIDELKRGVDRTHEVDEAALRAAAIDFVTDAAALRRCDFHIITVPTPVDSNRTPDLEPLRRASETVGAALAPGAIVVYESTVYPGATEELCVPILEAVSGLKYGKDFFAGYSPERINPGDRAHRLESVIKVVAGCNPEVLEIVAAVYGCIAAGGVYRAPSIRVAEAAKVVENIQRDLNIALMNELATLFDRLQIDTADVIEAAATKWNFMPFSPGLVGGHCIGVDPYYLTHKALAVGYTPRVILSGRGTNDGMPDFVAARMVRALAACGIEPAGAVVTILGFTFKENIPDVRNTAVAPLIRALAARGVVVQVHDPLADRRLAQEDFAVPLVDLDDLRPGHGVILAVPHGEYRQGGWPLMARLLAGGRGAVFDVKGVLDRAACPAGVQLERL